MKVLLKFNIAIFAITLFCLLNLIAQSEIHASEKFETSKIPELEFELVSKDTVVNFGNGVEIDIYIKNNTDREILICQVPSSGINFITKDTGGNRNTFRDKWATDSNVKPEAKYYIPIAAHSKKHFDRTVFDKEYLYESGKWSIKISQQCNFSGENLGLKAWTGTIESNALNISIESNLILEAAVEMLKIGEPGDRIDAYVPEKERQLYLVRFHVDKVLKGEYEQSSLGVRLHSPYETFGLMKENSVGKRFILHLNKEVLKDGREILLVHGNSMQN